MPYLTFVPRDCSQQEFVEFWGDHYNDPNEEKYAKNIARRPMTASSIRSLFEWKNGSALSNLKAQSIQRNFISRIGELQILPEDTDARVFLQRFQYGGPIWRIFWLHLWQPSQYPIFDQHVYRAMSYLQTGEPKELLARDDEKLNTYLQEYLPFWQNFHEYNSRQADRALWSFGRFIRNPITTALLKHAPGA